MKTCHSWSAAIVALALALALTAPASAQTGLQKIWDGISGRKPAPAPTVPPENDQRLIEILVELAFLSEPVTFPFYIEARVQQGSLHVRGSVPSRAVRDITMKLAQRSTSLPVIDELKENPNLKVQPTRMSPEQLQNTVRATLREALPRQAKNLQSRCAADGQVAVSGNVESFEQKLQISQALRRLHGCTAAINMTRVAYDPDGKLARAVVRPSVSAPPQTTVAGGPPTFIAAPTTPPGMPTSLPGPPPQVAGQQAPKIDVVNSSPLAGSGTPPQIVISTEPPVNAPSVPIVPTAPLNPQAPRLSTAQIQKRIQDACPRATKVLVSLKPTGEVKVEIHLRDENELEPIFNRVHNLPDMEGYRLDVNFIVGNPGKM